MKCCKDKHFEVKVKDAHQTGSSFFPEKIFAFDLPTIFADDTGLTLQSIYITKALYRGPPPIASVCIFLKNQTFRI